MNKGTPIATDRHGCRVDRFIQGVVTMKCPSCGAAELIHDTRDMPYTYKGKTTVISAVTADYCPACDEAITDMVESERVMREMQAFNKQVNATYVDPEYSAKVRRKLYLDQK